MYCHMYIADCFIATFLIEQIDCSRYFQLFDLKTEIFCIVAHIPGVIAYGKSHFTLILGFYAGWCSESEFHTGRKCRTRTQWKTA